MEGIDNFIQPEQNPYTDRITSILQKRLQPIAVSPEQNYIASQAAQHYALAGRDRTPRKIIEENIINPQLQSEERESQSAMGLYDLFEKKRALGDKGAQNVGAALDKITSDPVAQGKLLEWMHGLPETIDTGNPNKILMVLARGKKELGIQTDFERDEEKRKADLASTYALTKQRKEGGGSGSKYIQDAYKIMDETGLPFEKAYAVARNGVGQGRYVENGEVTMFPQYGESKETEEFLKARGKEKGEGAGVDELEYERFMAQIPSLINVSQKLYKLADAATYTKIGKFSNAFRRQLGVDVGDAAEARAKYENMVRTEVMPLLRPTFGAQFTLKEGEWMMDTLGNFDLSSEEKKAQIEARIQGWINHADYLARKAKKEPPKGIFKDAIPTDEDPIKAERKRRGI